MKFPLLLSAMFLQMTETCFSIIEIKSCSCFLFILLSHQKFIWLLRNYNTDKNVLIAIVKDLE